MNSLPYDLQGVNSHYELLVSIQSTLATKKNSIQSKFCFYTQKKGPNLCPWQSPLTLFSSVVSEVGDTLVARSSAADVEHTQNKLDKVLLVEKEEYKEKTIRIIFN